MLSASSSSSKVLHITLTLAAIACLAILGFANSDSWSREDVRVDDISSSTTGIQSTAKSFVIDRLPADAFESDCVVWHWSTSKKRLANLLGDDGPLWRTLTKNVAVLKGLVDDIVISLPHVLKRDDSINSKDEIDAILQAQMFKFLPLSNGLQITIQLLMEPEYGPATKVFGVWDWLHSELEPSLTTSWTYGNHSSKCRRSMLYALQHPALLPASAAYNIKHHIFANDDDTESHPLMLASYLEDVPNLPHAVMAGFWYFIEKNPARSDYFRLGRYVKAKYSLVNSFQGFPGLVFAGFVFSSGFSLRS